MGLHCLSQADACDGYVAGRSARHVRTNGAMEVCPYFRLDEKTAIGIIEQVKSAVRQWRVVATNYGISKTSQAIKEPAFRVVA